MKRMHVLDCTLRDGGYCNDWCFGQASIQRIISSLDAAQIDYIECGYLAASASVLGGNYTKYSSLDKLYSVIPQNVNKHKLFCMVNYGEIDINQIVDCRYSCISGIRVAFHKQDIDVALRFCLQLMNKGYVVFAQPMVISSYSISEYNELLNKVNQIIPHAMYIVDSFGTMKKNDVLKFFQYADEVLKKSISLGIHLHNNMQLSFSNTQSVIEYNTMRDIYIDSCVLGVGRGLGNLNTEILVESLNSSQDSKYNISPLLSVMEELKKTLASKWLFPIPYFLTAKYNAHPKYADYLADFDLPYLEIEFIIQQMDERKKEYFDKDYINEFINMKSVRARLPVACMQ